MTLDDLAKIYSQAWCDADPFIARTEAIRAVVLALRDEMVQIHLDGQEFGYADEATAIRGAEVVVDKLISKIIGEPT